MNSEPSELREIHISFLQWYCNPFEIAVFRTMAFFCIIILMVGSSAAFLSREWTQGLLMGLFGILILLISKKMLVQTLLAFRNGGVNYYFGSGTSFIEIGTHRSQIIRLEKKSISEKPGLLGMTILQANGNCNFVVPKYLVRARE